MKRYIKSETDDFIKRAVNFGQRNGLNIPELALAFSDGRRCSHEDYLKLCKWFKNQENVDRYYSGVELTSSRKITSSQNGFENVAEGTKYDDYHIDTNGMGILSVGNIIEEIEGRGNQAVLTVQTSSGSTNHSQFSSNDWEEYKDSVNDAGNAITDVWVTEVEGGSYVRNSHKITSARYIATDPESGEVLGSADTYEEAVNEWGEDVIITDSKAAEGQEEGGLFSSYDNKPKFAVEISDYTGSVFDSDYFDSKSEAIKWANSENHYNGYAALYDNENEKLIKEWEIKSSRKITSAVDGDWEVRSSDVPEALDLFVEYFGEEDALEEIAKAMGYDVLQENIEWIAQQWGFGEEIEGLDVWEQYEMAKEYMGVSELFNNLTRTAGYDELAEDLAFIFRMYDFREWDKYDNEDSDDYDEWKDDEEIESSLQNSFPIKTVKNIMSGTWTEKQAVQNIAQKQNINVGYARHILSSWIEQYKPKLIKSGILDIAEDINTEFDIDGDLESWAEQYTNPEGKSNTVGGEIVRAAMQIIYRYNNDGDMIGRGYGNETVNAAARYLIEKIDMPINEQIQKWLDHEERASDSEYDSFIETFTTEIEQILRENPELFQKPNNDDYWDWKEDEDMDYDLDECYLDDGNGNRYWFQLDNDRWTCTEIELDPNAVTYSEGDTINEGDEYSDEIDHTEEFGSFEADGFIYEYAGDDWDDEREEYTSWQITKVVPEDPYCDEGDTLDFYDLEPDELSGFRLFDHNGNEIDERTFLASSLKIK